MSNTICPHGGTPDICFWCKRAAYMRQYYREHPEKAREQRDRHKEKRRAAKRMWNAKNALHVAAYRRRPEVKAAQNARIAGWKAANPEAWAEREARRKARKAGSYVEKLDYKEIIQEESGCCYICGGVPVPPDLVLDHVVPLRLHGPHIRENVHVACRGCNSTKGSRLVSFFEPRLLCTSPRPSPHISPESSLGSF